MTTALLPGDSVRIRRERGIYVVQEVTTGHVLGDDQVHPIAKLYGGPLGHEQFCAKPVERLKKVKGKR